MSKKNKDSKQKQEPLITEKEAWDVIQFATALNNGVSSMAGAYSPWLQNQNLKLLNNEASEVPTYERVIEALTQGMNGSDKLHAYTEWMEWADMLFKRTIEYYTNILSFDLRVSCKNASAEDYGTKKYENDKAVVKDFFDNFDYKAEFRKAIRLMLRRETAFMWLRNNEQSKDTKYTLQIMPQSRCILTGYFESGLIYDFDMNYFQQSGVDIDQFDSIFKVLLNKMDSNQGLNNYIPTNPFNNRDGSYAYTVQTSPIYNENTTPKGLGMSGAWAFKLDNTNFSDVPFLSGLLRDAILNIPVQKLQYDKDVAGAHAMLIGEIGMLSSNEPNATEFDPIRLGKLLSIVKQAIGKYITVGAMPTKEVEWYQFKDENTTMYQDQMRNSAASGAGASRILYSSDKMSQEEIRNAIIADYGIMHKVYSQFQNFLDFYVNKLTKKFKFRFKLDGSIYPFERKDRMERGLKLLDFNMAGNPSYFASLIGIDPFEFEDMLEEYTNTKWIQKLPQIQSIHTQSGKSGPGAPMQEDVSSEAREYDGSDSS